MEMHLTVFIKTYGAIAVFPIQSACTAKD